MLWKNLKHRKAEKRQNEAICPSSSIKSLTQVILSVPPNPQWWLCQILCNPMDCSTPGFPVFHCLPELAQTHVHGVGDAIQPSGPLSSPSPAISLSQHQGLFQCVGSLHQVAKILELQLQHQSFHEYSGLVAFRIDWLDLLAAQGTLKSLLQHHSSKASIV